MNGATATGGCAGEFFGREGLDLATRWTCPGHQLARLTTPFKMFRNYDGNKSTFGDISVSATMPNPDALAAFAAVRNSDGRG